MRYRFLRYPGGKPKAVTFSYDDGVRHDIRLAETCNRYGIKCTFNINSAYIAKEPGQNKLTAEEIQHYILDSGHEVAVHGHEHKAPGACRPIDTIQDVLNCRLELEKTFGMIIRGMAYPDSGITKFHNNTNYANIKQNLQDLDIVYSRTLAGDNNTFLLPTDWHAWMPTAHHNNPKALEYAQEFVNLDYSKLYSAARYPRLYYLWGHSYEFNNNNNWEVLEALCETLGNKEDTWYPTNIELYEYVHAYNSLVFSADGTRIYNPTLIKVWFDLDGKLYSIDSGETLIIE